MIIKLDTQQIWKVLHPILYTICFVTQTRLSNWLYENAVYSQLPFLLLSILIPIFFFLPVRKRLNFQKTSKSSVVLAIFYCTVLVVATLGKVIWLRYRIETQSMPKFTWDQLWMLHDLKQAVIYVVGATSLFFIVRLILKKNAINYFLLMQSYIFHCFYLFGIEVSRDGIPVPEFMRITSRLIYGYIASVILFCTWFLLLHIRKCKQNQV